MSEIQTDKRIREPFSNARKLAKSIMADPNIKLKLLLKERERIAQKLYRLEADGPRFSPYKSEKPSKIICGSKVDHIYPNTNESAAIEAAIKALERIAVLEHLAHTGHKALDALKLLSVRK
jgi:hypothetical protein